VRINTISPGPVATALWLGGGGVAATVATAIGSTPDAVAKEAASSTVTGRFTRPEEWLTWFSSWPAIAPATPPVPTSSSMAV
jgi:NAD(P)-dependent dehydrogenase (short-subunit alcohol dehydrogenase family)